MRICRDDSEASPMPLLRLLVVATLALATSAEAADMAFFVKNMRAQAVAVELFSRDRGTVWPGDDQVFLVDPTSRKSIPLSCNQGEHICYGAWVNGDDSISAGVGPDNDQPCDTCCFICVDHTTESVELVP
jgi:hypothetical protein